MDIKFTTTITLADYKAFTQAAAKNSWVGYSAKFFLKFLILLIILGLVIITLVDLFNLRMTQSNFTTSIVTSIAVIMLFILIQTTLIKRMYPLENGTILGEHRFHLTDSEIHKLIGNHKCASTYDSILQVVETRNNIFLFIDKIAAYIINKPSIVSESDIDEIVSRIRSKCNS